MISPLQTWQHREHKSLWPAIGSLAVLMHVGAIGMSVPYLLSWQASSEQSDAAAIPIELVTVASENSTNSTQVETAPLKKSSPVSKRSEPAAEPQTEPKAVSPQSPEIASIAQQPLAPSPSENNFETPGELVEPSDPAEPSDSIEPSNPVEPAVPDRNEEEAPELSESHSPPAQAPTSSVEEDSLEESLPINSPEENDSSENSLPIANGAPLSGPIIGDGSGQSLQIRAVGAPQYDPVEDFEGTAPELIDTDYVGVLRPEAEGCGAVSALATQTPLLYRIAVSERGAIDRVSLQKGQAIAPDSADDRAVSCLIKKTGITFRRMASDEGAKPIDDSLLMTFELSEQ